MPPDEAAVGATVVQADTGPESPGPSPAFVSLLTADPNARASPGDARDPTDPELPFVSDLNLDQVIIAVAKDREERDLISELLLNRCAGVGTVAYRQEVFRDLENQQLFRAAQRFSEQMRQVRVHLGQLPKMQSVHHREGWFLDAASIYCDAVRSLAADLRACPISSRGLLAFRDYLASYAASPSFLQFDRDTAARRAELARVIYQIRIKGGHVEVTRYHDAADYSAEITATFERFQQGAVKNYLVPYRTWPGMTHVGARILDLVGKLFAGEFSALTAYCQQYAGFADPVIREFDRELQFYLAYLDYIGPLRSAGLSFCYPELTTDSREIFGQDTFDLALAARLVPAGKAVVGNEFHLTGQERVIVVSGPNQGGKTTFARTFGQLHHLAGTGCPVPGSAARLFVPDEIFTHFEREEDITNLAGKLETDLLRIQQVLRAATGSSIVIMNEIFTSTTVSDATFLGEKVLAKILELGLLCVYVTFIDELASLGPAVVSMASTIVPDNPAERTYKVVRKPADGLAYALAIAQKHHVTYDQLRGRLGS
jgi:DNA mismatch repair protein MutS